MGSNAEVIVPIETVCKSVQSGSPILSQSTKIRLAGRGARSFSGANPIAADGGVGKGSPEKEFTDSLVSILSTRVMTPVKKLRLMMFMAKSDEYPHFVWQNLLLSFGQERDPNGTFGPFALDKLSHLVINFPDVFQRELVRDSFQLAGPILEGADDRYGALHAAVLCGRTDLLHLLRERNHSRQRIFDALVPNESDDAPDSFHLLRRALLWRHMEKTSNLYAKVAAFMKDIEKARMLTELDREALGKLIDKVTIQQIDKADDAYDPWVVILAWSSVAKDRGHIVEEFKKRKADVFEEIVKNLKARKSAFTHFLTDAPEEAGKIILFDNTEEEVKRTVQDILKILVLQKKKNVRNTVYMSPRHSSISRMQRFFLDRFCESTPGSRWTPLHLAASRGDQSMVSVLIESWKQLVEMLGEELKKDFTRKLEKSFYDAKYMTPLHYAVLGNHKEVVKSLLDWKAFSPHVNECDIFMRTAFQIACTKQERASIAQDLLKNERVDVNTKDCCSFTSLHWAVHSGSTETVKHVIFDEKSRTIRIIENDNEGRNPYEMAARGKDNSHKDIRQLLLYHSAVKDQVERWYRDRQVYVDASNAILVGAALIASVTFGGWLQPPSEERFWDVRIFWGFNSLSFFFSIATVTSGAAAMLPVGDEYIKDAVESIRKWLVVTSCLLILSLACVLGAFAAAGFASLSAIQNWRGSDNNNMTLTTSVGGFVCAIMGLVFMARLRKICPDWLNQTRKDNREAFKKQATRRRVDSLVQLPAEVYHRFRDQAQPPPVSVEEIQYGPENFPTFNSIQDMISNASRDSLFRISFSTGVQDSLLPIKVDRDRVQKLWEKLHSKDDIKVSCPIRTYYKDIEYLCLYEISNLYGLDKNNSLREYMQMWKDLSHILMKATSFRDLVAVSKNSPSIT